LHRGASRFTWQLEELLGQQLERLLGQRLGRQRQLEQRLHLQQERQLEQQQVREQQQELEQQEQRLLLFCRKRTEQQRR
jgi:hypothetical protein